MYKLFAVAMLAIFASACSRVETGEVGLAKTWNGSIDPTPIMGGTGYHQTLTQTIYLFSAKEALFPIKNLHPQTRDKLTMEDVDISYGYSVNPQAIAELYTRYGPSAHWQHDGEIYPMAAFIENLLRAAVNDAVAKYDALQVNDNRTAIQNSVMEDVRSKIAAEKLDGKVNISQVVLTAAVIPASVRESATAVVTAQNALRTKQFELQTTQVEAQRMQALAGQADDRYIRYLNAQALLKMAESKPSYVIVPADFGKAGMVNMPAITAAK